MLAWGGNHFTPLLPLYRDTFSYSSFDAALLLAAYILGLAPALLAGAVVSARLGERGTLALGLVLGSAGSALLAAGPTSFGALAIGRVLAGLGIGAAMTAGVDLVRRLYVARARTTGPGKVDAAGLVRGSMTVTAGLAVGAAVSGAMATWAPSPTLLPYLAHIGVSTLAGASLALTRTPAAVTSATPGFSPGPGGSPMRLLAILLPAPWVFAAAAIAYAVVPEVVTTVPPDLRVAYAASLTLITLVVGTAVQPLGARLGGRGAARATGLGLAVMVPGFALAATAAQYPSALTGLIAAAVLGAGFGLALISGLSATRRLIAAGGGGGLVGAYYSATYLGFAAPAIVSALAEDGPAVAPLAVICGAAAICSAALHILARARGA